MIREIQKIGLLISIFVAVLYLVADAVHPLSGVNPEMGKMVIFTTIFLVAIGIVAAVTTEVYIRLERRMSRRRLMNPFKIFTKGDGTVIYR
jgi:uncharacterized membrane protein